MANFLDKVFGDPNKKALKKLEPIVARVNSFEPQLGKLTDDELKAKTDELRKQLKDGKTLDDILPEAFAVVREAAKRVLNERPFDVQVMGGIVLHQGNIAEMKTGEGKTLAATMPVYLNALAGKGAHVVTVNDYLAKRDAEWMGKIYEFLGLSVGAILHGKSTEERREAYSADVTYGTNNEFGFDYLRDNMAPGMEHLVQRDLNFAIVDEVDSILIDEARTPLIISAPDEESADRYKQFARIVPQLAANVDYNIDEKMRSAVLTDEGINKVENLLGIKNIYESGDVTLAHHIEQSLKAQALYKRDTDYVVKDDQVIIVDEFTGRLMPGRRYGEGLHQAIEAKEGVAVQQESKTLATITFQNFFRLYDKLSGMTGTAKTEEEEFYKIYGLEVVMVPTNKLMVRMDMNDLVFATQAAKFNAVVREIKERYAKGQPLLVGTISIEKSELLSDMLKVEGVPHSVLNAKHHEKEAEIVKDAGRKGMVTIATNMAGRGTDIKLGEGVVELGGLHIIGTERHESRRIDNQLRGRAGRQGDPGSSRFYVSMEDDLMRLFGSDRMKSLMKTLRVPEDQPLEHKMISGSIEAAQKKVEGHNFDIRKHVLQYDDVMNRQRAVIYGKRRDVLSKENLKDEIWNNIQSEFEVLVNFHCGGNDPKAWNIKEVIEGASTIFPLGGELAEGVREATDRGLILDALLGRARELLLEKEKEAGEETWRQVERAVYLRVIDILWIEHLDAMVRMREGIGLQGYAQKDPLAEYKQEAYSMFQRLLLAIASDTAHIIYKVRVEPPPTASPVQQRELEEKKQLAMKGAEEPKGDFQDEAEELSETPPPPAAVLRGAVRAPGEKKAKIGRNDPCPCGSGKKYKKCCGR
ncbi:preprotein translocase subunit SecA [candidate division Kazan bacterium RBG_13_50_9]|uniref:Protein translocase subunit SecA n=1 Tax=candidate division Kazan bacterium RBG_13_50_9 TaxID=1798535 RepID=A0A1F4NRN3_UNCK3|nr:MAG: preprotein translocase subunit SecA [candidate division Kazan bacterium RBG_13_50_9]